MTRALEQGIPINEEAERMILASICLDERKPNECFMQAAALMVPEDFGLDSHRRIFRAMDRLHKQEKPIEYVTLCQELDDNKEVEACGGSAYITGLCDKLGGWPRIKNIEQYIQLVHKAANQRAIIHASQSALVKAYEREAPGEIIGELTQELETITQRAQRNACVPVANLIDPLCHRLMQQQQAGGRFIGLPTPIGRLNWAMGGLARKELTVVAGDTGTGKTAFALNITEHNCIRDNPVHWFSMEMDSESLLLRLAASRTGINHIRIRNTGNLSMDEVCLVIAALDEIKRWPLWIDDTGGLTVREMYARGRMQAARGVKLIVSDYLQKLKAPGLTTREQVNVASECTRQLAKSGNVPVLSLSQLARFEKTSKDSHLRKPGMHDLKESGNIEQDAHNVLLLWREQKRDDEGRLFYTGNDAVIIGKNRNGPCFEVAVKYEPQIMVWCEIDPDNEATDGKALAAGNQ
jgi:replicative DNA helicase